MFKIILLNGPKLSGKDTLADLIVKKNDYTKMQFKDRLYDIGAKIAGIRLRHYIELCTDRVTKEVACEGLGYKSPRQHLIHVSEEVIKPLFGEDYFGEYLAEEIDCGYNYGWSGVVVSDSGFETELSSIISGMLDKCGTTYEIHVVRLYKNGCTFEGDSRDYLSDNEGFLQYHDITVVDGDIEGTYEYIQSACGGF